MMERFTDRGRKVMQLANQEAQRFNHEYIGTEHILLGLIHEGSGVAANVLKNLDIGLRRVRQEVEKIVQQAGPDLVEMGKLPQTPRAKKVIEYAIEEARNLDHNYVGTEHLLLGLLREQEGIAAQVLMNLGLKLETVRQEVMNLLGQGVRAAQSLSLKTRILDGFGRDLTALARQNQLDPVVGRDDEVERIFQILGRRTRNNPLLVGESGVGKTALAHALARRVAADASAGRTPFRRVIAVDCSWCAAGADDYEHFRKRLGSVADEARMAKGVLLFLDDLHRWDYSPYALAPLVAALTRGAIQCVAASAPREPRPPGPSEPLPCFEPIRVEPLTPSATLPVLAALRDRYAEHHRVRIADEAIQAAAEMASRCEGARRLPGIAVDVLDEACALVRLRAGPLAASPGLAELDERLARLDHEKEEAVQVQDFEKAAQRLAEAEALKRQRQERETDLPIIGVVNAAAVAEIVRQRGASEQRFLRGDG